MSSSPSRMSLSRMVHPWSPPQLRMFWREGQRRVATMSEKPGANGDAAVQESRSFVTVDPFLLRDRERLAALAGKSCPVCRHLAVTFPETLVFDGRSLYCRRGHNYSNPGVAEDEVAKEADSSSST